MPTIDELRMLQALPLDMKIRRTQQRIKEWVNYYGENGVYVSFSGGKDSTVLLHLARELYPNVSAVFSDTGLEYPEIRAFVKTFDNVTMVRPQMRFDEVIKQYGYPLIGKEVADYYQELAVKEYRSVSTKEVIEQLKAQGREKEIAEAIKRLKAEKPALPKDLCYLQGQSMDDYLHDMKICTGFADENRMTIANNIIRHFDVGGFVTYFTTRHNYISEDNYIRKGAIEAKKGTRVLIPLNMRDGCIIGIGKGNEDWNYSAPHGAGRVLSRTEARRTISVEEFTDTMKNVYSTTVDESTIDESPFAYKPSSEIIELVKDTVDIEKIIKPVYNYKAGE